MSSRRQFVLASTVALSAITFGKPAGAGELNIGAGGLKLLLKLGRTADNRATLDVSILNNSNASIGLPRWLSHELNAPLSDDSLLRFYIREGLRWIKKPATSYAERVFWAWGTLIASSSEFTDNRASIGPLEELHIGSRPVELAATESDRIAWCSLLIPIIPAASSKNDDGDQAILLRSNVVTLCESLPKGRSSPKK